jgi:DNA-binding NarL/FixJ family response regulator
MPAVKPPQDGSLSPGAWRVLVVEDHPVMCEAITRLLNEEPDFVVCGTVPTADQAMKAIAELKPDVVTTGIDMPSDGIDFIRKVVARWPKLPVLVLSMHEESRYAKEVLQAGALGYVPKHEAIEKLPGALRRILSVHIYD